MIHIILWHPNIRIRRHKCSLFLCVQEAARLLLRHIVTRCAAKRLQDNFTLPDSEITLGNSRSFDCSSSLLSDEFIKPGNFNNPKIGRYITVVEYSAGKSKFTPLLSRFPREKCYVHDEARRETTDSTWEHRERGIPKLPQARKG